MKSKPLIIVEPQDKPWLLTVWELLPTKAPCPDKTQPYCCYVRTVIFYLKPYVVRPWHHIVNWRGKYEASAPGCFEEWGRVEYVLFAPFLPQARCWIVWDKNDGKTPSNQADCELAWTDFDAVSRVFRHLWRGMMRSGEENITHGPKLHPHQKPLALCRFIIEYAEIPRGGACA